MKLIFKTILVMSLITLFVSPKILSAQTNSLCQNTITVQADDWLSKLATKYYGDLSAYPLIMEATNAKSAEDASYDFINNPDLIEIGQKLCIPDLPDNQQAIVQTEHNLDLIFIERPGLFPEGIEYDSKRSRFLVGSVTEGTIYEIGLDGVSQPFIEDANFKSTAGIHIDPVRDRLLVANFDPGILSGLLVESDMTGVGSYDLTTGERLFFTDLSNLAEGEVHFANDLAVDSEGNTYVTDSFAPVLYKIDPTGEASIFTQNPLFTNPSFGLNGIEYHPDDYLLVGVSGDGTDGGIYKIPLANPEQVTPVTLNTTINPDGMIFHPDGSLIVVNQILSSVYRLTSQDDWNTATVMATFDVPLGYDPTTATIKEDIVYVLYAHLDKIGQLEPPERFEIVKVAFMPSQ